jgi:tripartite-type tricarboxylate transporter receptor subunit TctC
MAITVYRQVGQAVLALAALGSAFFAHAQLPAQTSAEATAQKSASDWPNRSIRFVVPYAAGGSADTRMRLLARKLSDKLGQPIVIENKGGAGGVIGTDIIAKAAPDGYTIGSGNLAPLAVNVSLMRKLPYDPIKDIEPVILIENSPLVLSVPTDSPIKTVKDVITLAKKEPGKLNYGSSGVGGAHHLSGAMLGEEAQIDIVHVPYKGGAPASADLMAGHLSMMFEMGYAAMPSIQTGKVRPIAVSSIKRLPLLPDVPTMDESGLPGFESYNWQGIVGPAGLPAPIIAKLNQAFNEIIADPDVQRAMFETGSQPVGGSPEAFKKFILSETAKWAKVVKSANIQPE